MKSVPLKAYPRTAQRRLGVKKLRAAGRIPAVIYGRQVQPRNLEVEATELDKLIHRSLSENVLVDLSISSDARPTRLALVQEVQHHPLTGRVLHVDFHEVAEDELVTLTVPVEPVGEAVGVKGGGVLEHVMFRLKVRALPRNLPEVIQVDVTGLDIGKAIHLGDIKPPEGVELLGDKKSTVLSVAAPITEAQEAATAEAAAQTTGEVEMIKEKKEEPAAGSEKGGEKAEKADKAEKKK